MKPAGHERGKEHTPDKDQHGLVVPSLRGGVPVDELPLRETDAKQVGELRGGAKEELLAMAGFTTKKAAEESQPVEAKRAKTELSPEQVEKWLSAFKARFDVTPHLHMGVEFADVEKALRADPDAMRAFAELDQNGHETNVFGEDAKIFEIGTCAVEAAIGHRNIVFDEAAQDLLGEGEKCNGNTVDLAKEIGVDLMDGDQVNSLIKKLKKNNQRLNSRTWDWLKTDTATRKRGRALFVHNNMMVEDVANPHGDYGSFRAVRRVNRVA